MAKTKRCPQCRFEYPRGGSCPRCNCDLPTRATIRRRCRKLQASWSDADRERRTSSAYLPVPAEIHAATLVRYREDD